MIYKNERHFFTTDDLWTLDSLIPDSEKKTQIFNRLERALEHEKMIKKLLKKEKIKSGIIWGVPSAIILTVLMYLIFGTCIKDEPIADPFINLIVLIFIFLACVVIVVLGTYLTISIRWISDSFKYKMEDRIRVPESGFIRKEDIKALNEMLYEANTDIDEITAVRGLNAYEVIKDNERIDVTKLIRPGSDETVPIVYGKITQLELYDGRTTLWNIGEHLSVSEKYVFSENRKKFLAEI